MKKVLLLTSVASMIDQFNMSNISFLLRLGYEVHVACNFVEGNTCSEEKIEQLKHNLVNIGVKFYQIDFSRSIKEFRKNRSAYGQTKELLKRHNYDFIHCQAPIGGVIGRLAGHKTKTKVIYTAHGLHFYKGAPILNWLIFYPVEWILAWYTDVLITINSEDYIRCQKHMHAKQIKYVPGIGIDIGKFDVQIGNTVKGRIYKEMHIPENSFVLLSLGELNDNKNHEAVIRALANINNKNVHYVIAGQGRLERYLRNVAEELNLLSNIHLIGFRSDNIELFHTADAYILPSKREGLNVSLMEAMASRLPILCSRIRGNIDLVLENVNGFFFEANNIRQIEQKIEKMINCDRKSMGNESNKLIQKFSIHEVKDKMIDIYGSFDMEKK